MFGGSIALSLYIAYIPSNIYLFKGNKKTLEKDETIFKINNKGTSLMSLTSF